MPAKQFVVSCCGFAAIVFSLSTTRGEIIYRETFANSSTTVNQTFNDMDTDWAYFNGTTGVYQGTLNVVSFNNGYPNGTGAVANVNAGPPTTATNAGFFFQQTTTGFFVWTPEYAFNPSDFVADSIVFSWNQGNNSTTSAFRLAVEVNNQWYVTNSTFVNATAVSSAANFAASGGELKTFTYTTNASVWKLLNFDGAFNAVTNAGTNGTLLSMGATPGTDLPNSTIQAFGLYNDAPPNAINRIDTFTVTASPVPEPGTWLLLAAAACGGLLWRRMVPVHVPLRSQPQSTALPS